MGPPIPEGPKGRSGEGNQPIVGWCTPLGPPPAPRVETLGWGGRPTCLGGHSTPLGRRPLGRLDLPGPAPPLGAYIKEGRGEGSRTQVLVPLSPCYTSSSSRSSLAKPCRSSAASTTTPSCCWIIINLSFPLAGSRRRIRHADRTCVERGGAVRSALGSPVIGSRRERLLQPRSFERFRSRSTKWYVDASLLSLVAYMNS